MLKQDMNKEAKVNNLMMTLLTKQWMIMRYNSSVEAKDVTKGFGVTSDTFSRHKLNDSSISKRQTMHKR